MKKKNAATGTYSAAVMSTLCLASRSLGGSVLYVLLKSYLARGRDATPLLPPVEGRRVFDSRLVTLSWRWARLTLQALSTRRLQPQLRWIVIAALMDIKHTAQRRPGRRRRSRH